MMPLAFSETMRGVVRDAGGTPHLVEFDVTIGAPALRHFLHRGDADLRGVIRAEPWARDAPVEGRFHIDTHGMDYALEFTTEEGAQARLVGRKDLDPARLLPSMTTLHTRLLVDGRERATGTLHFDLNEVVALGASLRLRGDRRPRDIRRRPPGREVDPAPPLGRRHQRLLAACAAVLIPPGDHVPPVDGDTIDGALGVIAGFPGHVQVLLARALDALALWARLRTGRPFSALPVDRRAALMADLDHLGPGGAGLRLLLGVAIRTAHFGRTDYLHAVGAPTFDRPTCEPSTAEPPQAWRRNILCPDDLDPTTDIDADVVVVGTGAGGAVVAAELAERGCGVALVEAGAFYDRTEFSGPPQDRLARFYDDGGMRFSVGNTVISIPTGRMVGGSTAINSGTCFRTPPAVLAEWRSRGFPAEFHPDHFDRWFRKVETELQVAPGDARWLGAVAEVVARGAEALGAHHHPLPRNAPGCDGQGVCPVGCPTDARRSTNVSYVPRALRAGAALFSGMELRHLHRRGQRVAAVEARGQTSTGAPRRLRIRARAVVIAAGTLNSPRLLADNGIRLPHLGRNLSIHPALGMFARLPDPVAPWRAIPQGYGVTGLVDPRLRFEGFYLPPQLSGGLLPADGRLLTRWMDAADRVVQYGFMVRDGSVGRVRRGPGGRPLIHYSLTPELLDLFARGAAALAELLLAGGAESVLTGISGQPTVDSRTAAADLRHQVRHPSQLRLAAFHPLGTCRMAASPDEGVVDFDHRVFGTDNLYVIDGSSVPSSLGVNPQVTI
ncbi:MAG: hypothetical protein D6798_15930, partial [Deltaproteobacteria bacterium]